MEILDFAKEIETRGAEHYSNLAKRAREKEIAGIFGFLEQEERRHYEIFDSWQKNEPVPAVDETNVMGHAKKSFERLREHFQTRGVPAIDRDDAYEKALEFEKKSIAVYTDALDRNRDELDQPRRTLLRHIIKQEENHARLITSLMEFQRHPGEWLENAEWHHFDEY